MDKNYNICMDFGAGAKQNSGRQWLLYRQSGGLSSDGKTGQLEIFSNELNPAYLFDS
jgi:hypothetical protein